MAVPQLRVGLTGGIGSGKSTAATMLAALGAYIVDTDAISRQITAPGGSAIAAITEAFGSPFIDAGGALDRERMRSLVFADEQARRKLEGILHPLIGRETARQAEQSTSPMLVFDVPLLVESGRWRQQVDRILVIDCGESTQIERVAARPGWTRETAAQVIARQASRAKRRACADAVIYNDGILPLEFDTQLRELWRHWQA